MEGGTFCSVPKCIPPRVEVLRDVGVLVRDFVCLHDATKGTFSCRSCHICTARAALQPEEPAKLQRVKPTLKLRVHGQKKCGGGRARPRDGAPVGRRGVHGAAKGRAARGCTGARRGHDGLKERHRVKQPTRIEEKWRTNVHLRNKCHSRRLQQPSHCTTWRVWSSQSLRRPWLR